MFLQKVADRTKQINSWEFLQWMMMLVHRYAAVSGRQPMWLHLVCGNFPSGQELTVAMSCLRTYRCVDFSMVVGSSLLAGDRPCHHCCLGLDQECHALLRVIWLSAFANFIECSCLPLLSKETLAVISRPSGPLSTSVSVIHSGA